MKISKKYFIIILGFIFFINCQNKCENSNKSNINTNNNPNNKTNNSSEINNSFSNNMQDNIYFGIKKPEEPRLKSWLCPENWQKVSHNDVKDENNNLFSWCEPPTIPRLMLDDYITPLKPGEVENDFQVCDTATNGTFPLVGKSECQTLGSICPEDEYSFPDGNITNDYIYVSNSFVENGEGTIDSPFSKIMKAIESANSGDIILVGKGIYEESIKIDKDISIYGACVQKTIIKAPGPHEGQDGGAIIINSDIKTKIQNLRVSGEQNGIYIYSQGAEVTLENLWVNKAKRYGIVIFGGKLYINNSLINSTQPANDLTRGRGLGMFSYDDTFEVIIKRTTFEMNNDIGITATLVNDRMGPVGYFLLEDVIVRETQPQISDDLYGIGINIVDGPEFRIENSIIDSNYSAGLVITGEYTKGVLENTIISNTNPQKFNNEYGYGIEVSNSTQVELNKCLLNNNTSIGVYAFKDKIIPQITKEIELTINDTIVKNTQSSKVDYFFGHGIGVVDDVKLSINRTLIEKNRTFGMIISNSDSESKIEDLIIRKTLSKDERTLELPNYGFGLGLVIRDSRDTTISRMILDNNKEIGLKISGSNTYVNLTDVKVINTKSWPEYFIRGRGINIHGNANVEIERAELINNKEVGIVLMENSKAFLKDVTILDTQEHECTRIPPDSQKYCGDLNVGSGYGIVSVSNSKISIENVIVSNNATLGIQLVRLGTISGENLLISKNPIGLNIQETPEDYTFLDEVKGLIMIENVINFDSQELQVPEIILNDR